MTVQETLTALRATAIFYNSFRPAGIILQ